MKIRSITYFCNPGWPLHEKILRQASAFLGEAKAAFEAEGYEVQTVRLATLPFPRLLGQEIGETPRLAETLSRLLPELGIAYASLGPARPDFPQSYALLPEAIAASQNIFFGGVIAERGQVFPQAIQDCARVIVRLAPLDPNGFVNLRFAALANVPAGAPFFPAAYHEGEGTAFALAMEAADVAVSAFVGAQNLEEGRAQLVATLEEHGRKLSRVAEFLKFKHQARFGGIDFSLAPFPEESRSLGAAIERMGVPKIGLHGSLAAAALLTEAIERANFPRIGFSGFMPPVLEDAILARRAAEGTLTVKDLLLYAAVCGTGLDTVPLPGEVTAGQIAALLLDLAVLALRLDKPLTARLMPIPGKGPGEPTNFDFGFFANSRVLALEAEPLGGVLAGQRTFLLGQRRGN